MAETTTHLAHYHDRVLGCWTGKTIGGTLGAPFEGHVGELALDFYAKIPDGEPAPNDDLDLQLIWLEAAETHGIDRITPRLLAEYWLDYVLAGWNEYGVCTANLRNGIYPPLSGFCGNRRWGFSNGAWIRSEIWSCLFPGDVQNATRCAWMDSCLDHYGEGIYAEIFTAALESAAFVVNDPRKLVEIALAMIPRESLLAQSVRRACDVFAAGGTPSEARSAVLERNTELGDFQSPANVAFVVIGLLWGAGEFGKTICTAANCGDDTDCTAATAGAIMGILLGRSGIPEKWTRPIGDKIRTATINPMHNNIAIPATLDELACRVEKLARRPDGTLLKVPDAPINIPPSDFMRFELPWGELLVRYRSGAEALPGESLTFELTTASLAISTMDLCSFRWLLPAGWRISPGAFGMMRRCGSRVEFTVEAGEFSAETELLQLEVTLAGRKVPEVIHLPILLRGSFDYNTQVPNLLEERRQLVKQWRTA